MSCLQIVGVAPHHRLPRAGRSSCRWSTALLPLSRCSPRCAHPTPCSSLARRSSQASCCTLTCSSRGTARLLPAAMSIATTSMLGERQCGPAHGGRGGRTFDPGSARPVRHGVKRERKRRHAAHWPAYLFVPRKGRAGQETSRAQCSAWWVAAARWLVAPSEARSGTCPRANFACVIDMHAAQHRSGLGAAAWWLACASSAAVLAVK